MLRVKRVYEEASTQDGIRVLVDRIWPRGVSKVKARLDEWLKEVAPSDELRKWFRHDPARWEEFKGWYGSELDTKPEAVLRLRQLASRGTLTLIYSAADDKHNNAVALKEYLEEVTGAFGRSLDRDR